MIEKIIPELKLTVVIRDDGPLVTCNDCPTYRSVTITLAKEQLEQIALLKTYRTGGKWHPESISKCFLEPIKEVSNV